MAHVSLQDRIAANVVDELREMVARREWESNSGTFPWLTVSGLALGAFLLARRSSRKALLLALIPPALDLLKSWWDHKK